MNIPVEIPDQPIVYQMGKVGSVSVQVALRQRGYRSLHSHNLIWEEGDFYTPKPGLLAAFRTNKEQIFRVITLVREPVARNVSAYFQQLQKYHPQFKQFTVKSLLETFLNNYQNHDSVLEWFDKEFHPVTGIDIYAENFDPNSGYQMYTRDNFRLLLIRTEDLDTIGGLALSEFLHRSKLSRVLKKFTVGRHNVLVKRGVAFKDAAHCFYKEVALPGWYLDKMYSNKFARHFYSDSERNSFYEYWRKRRV